MGNWIYEYDDNNNCTKKEWYRDDGSLQGSWIDEYDEFGNIIKQESIFEDSISNRINIYQYDVNGNEIEWKCYKNDGILYSQTNSFYDKSNNIIETNLSDSIAQSKILYSYKYDRFGNWIEQIFIENNIPKFLLKRKYVYR